MKSNMFKTILGGICLATALFAASSAKAITIDLNYEFSGATPPSGATPWVSINITDNGSGTVSLTIDNAGLVGTEFNSITLVNLVDAFRGTLSIVQSGSSGSFSAAAIAQQTGAQNSDQNPFKADGDGFFDVAFSFATSGDVFGAGDSVTYTITSSVSGLSASSFDLTSFTGGGAGVWHAAAHIQANNVNGESGWIGDQPGGGSVTPDGGSTIALLGLALVGADYLRRKLVKA